ncbi:DUF4180 domain-containing protein [Maribellus maritimus]|uniref:DUF4180 domain-containing protein n=1 Tax=Maribellus maritimus TaxID=2870838 RepID=UPI001EEA9410|nr:DUF4180 domain-containing protein [Maribellus maritimus]MCG6186397.1 DUF4180 domain-containing protein [Maribellus maritimus]
MKIKEYNINNSKIAELVSEEIIISSSDDGLELLGNLYYQGFGKIIIHEQNIVPAFFDLKNGMAGEILQKFSNYRVQLAVVGDFSKYTKKSICDFIYESNRRKQVNFVASVNDVIAVL